MKVLQYCYLVAGCCVAAACHNSDTAKTVAAVVNPKPVLQQPFRYHKLIEVAPGMDYDIFSWGRGPAQTGAYIIMRSDSADKKYTTTTGDIDGKLVDAFNTDLDTDGNPEIFIQSQTADSTRYDKIEAYEFNDDNTRKLDFPKLTSSQKKGYHGGDEFSVRDNKLIRSYTVYEDNTANAKPTGQKRTLEYSFHNNDFSVKQVSTDTTSASSQKAVSTSSPATTAPEHHTRKNQESSHHSRRERRHESRRHHSSESHHRSSSHHHESGRRRHHRR